MPIAPMTPDTMAALSVEAAEAAIVWLHVHRAEVWLATEIAAGLVLAYLAIWALLRMARENVCPDPYDPQDFIGVESLRPTLSEPPTPKHQPWQDWADLFPRYTDAHDGPGGQVTNRGTVVPWRRIAKSVGVSQPTVSAVVTGARWA